MLKLPCLVGELDAILHWALDTVCIAYLCPWSRRALQEDDLTLEFLNFCRVVFSQLGNFYERLFQLLLCFEQFRL